MKSLITYSFMFGAIVAMSESQILGINNLISVVNNATNPKNGNSSDDELKNNLLDLLKKDSKETQNYSKSEKECSEEDSTIWNGKNEESKKTLDDCGGLSKCMGESECVKKCMKSKMGFSDKCATCFGEFTQCGKSNCSFRCICKLSGNNCESCKNCVKTHCEHSFTSRTGFSSLFD